MKKHALVLVLLVALGWIVALLTLPDSARADEEIDADTGARHLHLMLSPEVAQVVSPSNTNATGGSLSSMGVGVGLMYGFSDRWGGAVGLRQMFTTGGDFLFTNVDLKLITALTGSLIVQRRDVSVSGKSLYEYEESYRGGLRLQAEASQYLFTTSVSVVPFTGFGGSVYYEFPTRRSMNYLVGARMDLAVGAYQTLIIPQLFGGVAFCF